MSEYKLKVALRDTRVDKPNQLRAEGRVPGIYYAHDQENVVLSVDTKELMRLLNTEATIVDVLFPDGKTKQSIIRHVQYNPVSDMPVHFDIMGIRLDEKVKLTIPIILQGTAVGVKEGGILEHHLREVEVEGLPLDIPEHLEIDISELKVGDSVILEQLQSDKYTISSDLHHPVVHVVIPKAVTEPVEEELGEIETEEAEEEEAES